MLLLAATLHTNERRVVDDCNASSVQKFALQTFVLLWAWFCFVCCSNAVQKKVLMFLCTEAQKGALIGFLAAKIVRGRVAQTLSPNGSFAARARISQRVAAGGRAGSEQSKASTSRSFAVLASSSQWHKVGCVCVCVPGHNTTHCVQNSTKLCAPFATVPCAQHGQQQR